MMTLERPAVATTHPLLPIAVAIVSFNTQALLRECLQSIEAEGAQEVVVVDNASHDGSAAMVQAGWPDVTLLANRDNPGYGAAANQAIAACQAPYVVLLNSDTRLRPGALAALGRFLDEHPRVAIAGPRLVNPDGSQQASCYPFPTPLHLFLEESTLGRLVRFLPGLRERSLRTWSQRHAASVPWVLGAALAIRRSAWEAVGGFDPRFFLYFEEVDLCYRLRAAGWEVAFTPDAEVVHVGGASTAPRRTEMNRLLFASAARFYRHHYSRGQMAGLRLVVIALMLARSAREGWRLRGRAVPAECETLTQARAGWQRIRADAQQGWANF